jgi:N-acetylglucosamine kinase-like BadF-type ATPase
VNVHEVHEDRGGNNNASRTHLGLLTSSILSFMRIAIGLDGGGTKTDCVLMEEGGRVIALGRGGPSNSSRIGVEAATRGVKEAADAALHKAELKIEVVTDVCAGLAGVADADRAALMTKSLTAEFPGARFELCTDLDLALIAAGPAPAIVLVAGTGSAAIGRDAAGRVARSGGYGPKKSDEGSAFAVGKNAVHMILSASSKAAANLRTRILEHLGLESLEKADGLEGEAADSVYPRVFPVIANAADEGNEIAQNLLQGAAANLAVLVAGVQQDLNLTGTAFVLGKTGGMIERSKYLDEALDRELLQVAPGAKLQILRTPLAEIAARRALNL